MTVSEPVTKSLLCPVCRVDLVMSERQNIEIDYCPKCRGVWLDRGELDKIIEKSLVEASAPPMSGQASSPPPGSGGAAGPWGQPNPAGSSPPDAGYGYPSSDSRGWSHHSSGGHGRRDDHRGYDRHGRGFLGRLFD